MGRYRPFLAILFVSFGCCLLGSIRDHNVLAIKSEHPTALIAYPLSKPCDRFIICPENIGILNPESGQVVELQTGLIYEDSLQGANSSGQLTYRTREEDGIFVINIDGTGNTKLALTGDVWPLAWSPTDTQFALLMRRSAGFGFNLYAITSENLTITQLTDGLMVVGRAAWSPDGTSLLFPTDQAFYIVDAAGKELTQFTYNGITGNFPQWSPDGERIAFVSEIGKGYEIFLMDANGNHVEAVAEGVQPLWVLGGTHLLYAKQKTENTWEFILFDPIGKVSEPLLERANNCCVAVSPAGRQILYSVSDDSDFLNICIFKLDNRVEQCFENVHMHNNGRAVWVGGGVQSHPRKFSYLK